MKRIVCFFVTILMISGAMIFSLSMSDCNSEVALAATKKVPMPDIKINVKTSRIITIRNPYDTAYKLKYDKTKLRITQYLYYGDKAMYTITGLKKGNVTVKATIKGKTYGSFKVKIGDFKAYVKKSYKSRTIKYNKHMKSYFLYEGGTVDIGEAVANFHSDGIYTVEIKNKKIAGVRKLEKDELYPKRVEIYALKEGTTTVTVYEKRKNDARKKVGTIKLTVNKDKDSEVFEANRMFDNDGIFYENYISPGDSFDLKSAVIKRYINCGITGSLFGEDEYSFSFSSEHPEVISVDENGICTCNGIDNDGINKIYYTITFEDGSTVSGGGSFDVWLEEDLPF